MPVDEITEPIPPAAKPVAAPQASETLEPIRERTGPWIQLRVPHGFEFNRYEVPIDGLRPDLDGLRIVHITDMHFNAFWSSVYDQIIDRVNRSDPDLILISGDFVDSKTDRVKQVPYAMRLVAQLRARLGVYGILGNHDGDFVAPYLLKTGIRILDDRLARPIDGLEIVGTADVSRDDIDWLALQSLPPKPPGGVRLLMSHYPDSLRQLAELRPDVMFAGHTHGGQICLPGGFPIIRHDTLPRRLCKGVHRVGKTWLVVSRGLGFTSLPIRVFCPAEVIEIVLKREDMRT